MRIGGYFRRPAPSRLAGASVVFPPGSRTPWKVNPTLLARQHRRHEERQRDRVLERFGRVDLVVVSTGILPGAPSEEAVPGDWVQIIDLNLHGLLLTTQTFADDLLACAVVGWAT